MRVSYVIVFVSDMQRSIAFYRDVLGIPMRFESPGWTEFATEGATLALHVSDAPKPERADLKHEPAGCCRPGLNVADLNVFHQRMIEKGVTCLQEPREVFGSHIAQYVDPDELVISVSEERRSR